jgi:hypothetical protein
LVTAVLAAAALVAISTAQLQQQSLHTPLLSVLVARAFTPQRLITEQTALLLDRLLLAAVAELALATKMVRLAVLAVVVIGAELAAQELLVRGIMAVRVVRRRATMAAVAVAVLVRRVRRLS